MTSTWEKLVGHTRLRIAQAVCGSSRLKVETRYRLDEGHLAGTGSGAEKPVARTILAWESDLLRRLLEPAVPDQAEGNAPNPQVIAETVYKDDPVVRDLPRLGDLHAENVVLAGEHWHRLAGALMGSRQTTEE